MPQTELEFSPGDRVRLTAAKDGNATDVSWRWVPPSGSSAPASTTNVLEWTTGANDAGVYDVEATSPTASDSPGYGVMLLKLPPPPATDADAAAVLSNVINVRGGVVSQPVQDAYTRHVIRLKQKGLWDGGTNEIFCYFSGVSGGDNVLLAQSSWIRKDSMGDNWDFFNMVSADHDSLNGIIGDGISKHAIMTRQLNMEGNSTWLAFTTESGDTDSAAGMLVGYESVTQWYGQWLFFRNFNCTVGGPAWSAGLGAVDSGIAGYGVSRIDSLTLNAVNNNTTPLTQANTFNDDGNLSPAGGPAVFANVNAANQSLSMFSPARIFLIWCRPNTMTPFTGQQMVDFIEEVKQYYAELQVAMPGK